MLVLRCTKKLQSAIRLKKSDLADTDVLTAGFNAWHLNLVEINGCSCLLAANDATLFNFLIADIPQLNPEHMVELLKSYLHCVLAEEGFDQNVIKNLMNDFSDVRFANTNNRRILGSMKELAFMYSYHFEDEGIHQLPEIIKKMNRTILGMIDTFAIHKLHDLLGLERPKIEW